MDSSDNTKKTLSSLGGMYNVQLQLREYPRERDQCAKNTNAYQINKQPPHVFQTKVQIFSLSSLYLYQARWRLLVMSILKTSIQPQQQSHS